MYPLYEQAELVTMNETCQQIEDDVASISDNGQGQTFEPCAVGGCPVIFRCS